MGADLGTPADGGPRPGKQLDIPVPPNYTSADFVRNSYWRLRGKLDMPKERFISYPGQPDSDDSLLLGWAGWDHREQAHALVALIEERSSADGWAARLTPLLAGLAEVMPWVRQWHDEVDPVSARPPPTPTTRTSPPAREIQPHVGRPDQLERTANSTGPSAEDPDGTQWRVSSSQNTVTTLGENAWARVSTGVRLHRHRARKPHESRSQVGSQQPSS